MIISSGAQQAMCNALVDLLDVGTGDATISFYTATQPAGPGTAVGAQILLAVCDYSATAFGSANSSGVATANAIAKGTILATNTPTWCRNADKDALAVFDASVGTSGTDFIFGSVSWAEDDEVQVDSLTVTQPSGA